MVVPVHTAGSAAHPNVLLHPGQLGAFLSLSCSTFPSNPGLHMLGDSLRDACYYAPKVHAHCTTSVNQYQTLHLQHHV